jgi:lipopolysaccharide transport system ATP-binding protein
MSIDYSEIFDANGDIGYFIVEGGDFFGTGREGLPTHCKILHKAEWFTE